MKKTYFFVFVAVLCFCSSCSPSFKNIPDDVLKLANTYLDDLKNSEDKPIDLVYFKEEHDMERNDYINQVDPLLSYKIDAFEKVNDSLYSLIILYELESTKGNYIKAFNFIGNIDGKYLFIVNQKDIPDDIKDNFDPSLYIYSNEELLDS